MMLRVVGKLVWKTQLEAHPFAQVTQSPVVYQGKVYVGVSSQEVVAARSPLYKRCCTFRGSMLALDVETGRVLWKTYMVPDNRGRPGGYAGASVWGSSPAIDESRRVVYIATGNNHSVPKTLGECVKGARNKPKAEAEPHKKRCLERLDLVDGMVYWGSGYQQGFSNNRFYAFALQ